MWFSAADPKRNKPLTYSLTSSSNDLSTIGITIQKSSRFAREVSLTFLDALLRSDWRSAESLTAWVVKPCKSSSDGWRVSETPQCRTHLEQSALGALLPSVFNSLPRKARIPTQRKYHEVGWQCDLASEVSSALMAAIYFESSNWWICTCRGVGVILLECEERMATHMRGKNTNYISLRSQMFLPMGLHGEQSQSSCLSDCSPEKIGALKLCSY